MESTSPISLPEEKELTTASISSLMTCPHMLEKISKITIWTKRFVLFHWKYRPFDFINSNIPLKNLFLILRNTIWYKLWKALQFAFFCPCRTPNECIAMAIFGEFSELDFNKYGDKKWTLNHTELRHAEHVEYGLN